MSEIQMASKVLTAISKNWNEHVAYIERLIWTINQESKILYAEKRGKLKGKLEIARNMLKVGMDIELINKYTGLSSEDIEKLSLSN